MNNDYIHSIEFWAERFREFEIVEYVEPFIDSDYLNINVKDHKKILHASIMKLNDLLYKLNGNPHEVVAHFLKKHKIRVYYQDTLVGFFDIQAYSNYINTTKTNRAIRKTIDFINNVICSTRTDIYAVKIDHWILSDSFILVVDTNRHPLFAGSLEVFLGTCSMLMREAVREGFPIRGAIGGGYFYKDK